MLDRIGAIDGDLVVGFVALFDAQVIIFEVDVEIGENEALTDPLPDDPRHFVAVDLHDRVFDLDLRHAPLRLLHLDGIATRPRQSGGNVQLRNGVGGASGLAVRWRRIGRCHCK